MDDEYQLEMVYRKKSAENSVTSPTSLHLAVFHISTPLSLFLKYFKEINLRTRAESPVECPKGRVGHVPCRFLLEMSHVKPDKRSA